MGKSALKRFRTIDEAIDGLEFEYRCFEVLAKEELLRRFSQTIRQESYQRTHNILCSYAQRKAKCTKDLTSSELESYSKYHYPDDLD